MKFFFNLIKLISHIVVNFNIKFKKPFVPSIFPVKFPTLRIFFSRLRNGPTERQYKILIVKKPINDYFFGIYERFVRRWNFLKVLAKFVPILLFFILVFISIFVSYLFFCDSIKTGTLGGNYYVLGPQEAVACILESCMVEFFVLNDIWEENYIGVTPPPINMIKSYVGLSADHFIPKFLLVLRRTSGHNKDVCDFIYLFNLYYEDQNREDFIDSERYAELYATFKYYFFKYCSGTLRSNFVPKINDYKNKFDISAMPAFYGHNRDNFCLNLVDSLKFIELVEGPNRDHYKFTEKAKNTIFFFLNSIARNSNAAEDCNNYINEFNNLPNSDGMNTLNNLKKSFGNMLLDYHFSYNLKICDPERFLDISDIYRYETDLVVAHKLYDEIVDEKKKFKRIMYLKKYKNFDEANFILMDSFDKILARLAFLKVKTPRNVQWTFWYKNYNEALKMGRYLTFLSDIYAYDKKNDKHEKFAKSIEDFYGVLRKGSFSKNYYEVRQFDEKVKCFKENFEQVYAKNVKFLEKLNKEIILFEEKK